ncbi:hypothetical protein [Erythrobacter rubeus]|uniref:Uncharacterized protein n=1 Tax=Erythrobacter rubeus TaxID=2760803 RepID=A0ABR8KN61_9SPHN|nr:hypothetical protein [Erythrobacter rubeus]MBD2840697.1 hypothetical protein [Erythrobacter rubeus]
MALPVAALSLVTLGAAAAFGGTQYLKAKKAKKTGEAGPFANDETDPVGIKMDSPYEDDAELPGTRQERKNPTKAPKSPSRTTRKSKSTASVDTPHVSENA